jgi:transaldolase/glucose-6-phosphate isomerase
MGEAALAGRDKLTIFTSPRLASLGDWIEQLVAESTGKSGYGIVPVVGEPIGAANDYGPDRQFVFITSADDADPAWSRLAAELEGLGHPGLHIELAEPLEIGAEFVRWEVATAATGILLGIDPFDQPDVQEAKDATRALLAAYRRDGALPQPGPLVAEPGIAAYGDPAALRDEPVTVDGALRALLATASDGDYFALLAYLRRTPRSSAPGMRGLVRTGMATTPAWAALPFHRSVARGAGVDLQLTAELPRPPDPGLVGELRDLIAAGGRRPAALQRRGRSLRLHLANPAAGLAAGGDDTRRWGAGARLARAATKREVEVMQSRSGLGRIGADGAAPRANGQVIA